MTTAGQKTEKVAKNWSKMKARSLDRKSDYFDRSLKKIVKSGGMPTCAQHTHTYTMIHAHVHCTECTHT